jgi:hypothetical protein
MFFGRMVFAVLTFVVVFVTDDRVLVLTVGGGGIVTKLLGAVPGMSCGAATKGGVVTAVGRVVRIVAGVLYVAVSVVFEALDTAAELLRVRERRHCEAREAQDVRYQTRGWDDKTVLTQRHLLCCWMFQRVLWMTRECCDLILALEVIGARRE